jgi:hypothetical protein
MDTADTVRMTFAIAIPSLYRSRKRQMSDIIFLVHILTTVYRLTISIICPYYTSRLLTNDFQLIPCSYNYPIPESYFNYDWLLSS